MCALGRTLVIALAAAACTGDITPGTAAPVSEDTDATRSLGDRGASVDAQPTATPTQGGVEGGDGTDPGDDPSMTPGRDAGATDGTATEGSDASLADAGEAPTADACETAIFCDDFEDDAVGAGPGAPWKIELNNGTANVDDAKAFRGQHAVRFTVPASSYARAYITLANAPVFPVAGDAFFGRMMIYLSAAPTGAVHWTNVEAEGDVPNQTYRGLYRYGGMHDDHLLANYETRGTSSDCWQNSDARMPQGRWTCLEWHYDAPSSTMELWIDGDAIDDQTVIGRGQGCIANGTDGNWYGPAFDTLRLGWEHYQQTDAKEMWIDDVAIGAERLGCPSLP